MSTEFIKSFPVTYDARVVSEPTAEVWRCYPGAVEGGRVAGVGVEFSLQNGDRWFGTFAEGTLSPTAIDYAGAAPGGRAALIVSRGEGYLIEPDAAERWQALSLRPIKGVVPLVGLGVVILWDFTRFLCLDDKGIRWRTPSVSWDGISNVAVSGEEIVARVWDEPSASECPVRVVVKDGCVVGGSSPELLGIS